MVEDDSGSRRTGCHGSPNELALLQGEDARAHDSRVRGPDCNTNDKDFEVDIIAKNRNHHDKEEERRDHEDNLERAGEDLIDPASVISGDQTERGTQSKGEGSW